MYVPTYAIHSLASWLLSSSHFRSHHHIVTSRPVPRAAEGSFLVHRTLLHASSVKGCRCLHWGTFVELLLLLLLFLFFLVSLLPFVLLQATSQPVQTFRRAHHFICSPQFLSQKNSIHGRQNRSYYRPPLPQIDFNVATNHLNLFPYILFHGSQLAYIVELGSFVYSTLQILVQPATISVKGLCIRGFPFA